MKHDDGGPAWPTYQEALAGITDSRFVGHDKIEGYETNSVRAGARIMYDRLYVMLADTMTDTEKPENTDEAKRA